MEVEGRVGVKEAGTMGDGRDKGVDRWVAGGVFKVEVRGVSVSKPVKSRG